MNFYKITKAQANLIGKFEYAPNQVFSPFVGEQVDGCYIVSEDMYNLLKDSNEFKRIDWSTRPLIPKENLQPK